MVIDVIDQAIPVILWWATCAGMLGKSLGVQVLLVVTRCPACLAELGFIPVGRQAT